MLSKVIMFLDMYGYYNVKQTVFASLVLLFAALTVIMLGPTLNCFARSKEKIKASKKERERLRKKAITLAIITGVCLVLTIVLFLYYCYS